MQARPRKRATRRRRNIYFPFGMGVQVTSQVYGDSIPKRLAVRQRGGWVDARFSAGERDRPEWSRT